jgi:hypothetical protein
MRLHHLLVAMLLHVPVSAGDHRLPEVIRHKHNPAVLAWVSESAAFDAEGRLREDLAASSRILERNLRNNSNGRCEEFIVAPEVQHFLPDTTLSDVATSSLVALSGSVVHVSRGFFNDFPGTLIGFRVTDRLGLRSGGNTVKVDRGDVRYTFIAAAEILRPNGAICSTTARTVTIPKPGDAILLFAYFAPIDTGDLIVPVDASRHLVIERNGNRIFTPANLADDLRGLAIVDVMRRVAEVAERPRSKS